jgi:hypothetical protein
MTRLILPAAAALATLAATGQQAFAWTKVQIGGGFNICVESTGRSRCFSYTSCPNPPPCGYCCGPGYGGPAPFDALGAYAGYAGAPYPGAAGGAPAGTYTPPAPTPAPAPAPKSSGGAQQAAYYAQTGYGYTYGYGPGYTYGQAGAAGSFQAPSYWYDR